MNKNIPSSYLLILSLKHLLFPVAVFIFTAAEIFPQTKTNLDIFYTLIDSSVNDFLSQVPQSEDSINIELNLGESYTIFENKIIAGLYLSGKFPADKNKHARNINYIINDANTKYGEIYRDGFFGDFFIPRKISLKGNYLVKTNSTTFKEFNYSFSDSIKYDEINYVENESFLFTKGDVPPEPFFSGLFEPVVAIGTTALAVILFFSIRSK